MSVTHLAAFLVSVLALGGCALGGIRPATVTAQPPSNKAVVVYGLDASRGPVQLALAPVKKGSCSGQMEARSPKDSTGITYFAFEVPPGVYTMSAFSTVGFLGADYPAAFEVPAGQRVLIGVFRDNSGILELNRDLEQARALLGEASGNLTLAAVADTDVRLSGAPMCHL